MEMAVFENINQLWLIDAGLLAVLLIMIMIGVKRGFVKSVSGLVSLIGAWICADRFSGLLHRQHRTDQTGDRGTEQLEAG